MSRQKGFTLVELLVSLSILGILFATAIPVYHTWLQRTYGQEAKITAKRIIDGQILYFLDRNTFFPPVDETLFIPDDGNTDKNIERVSEALKITIPTGHKLDYQFHNYGQHFLIMIHADFPLFDDGSNTMYGYLFEDGSIQLLTAEL